MLQNQSLRTLKVVCRESQPPAAVLDGASSVQETVQTHESLCDKLEGSVSQHVTQVVKDESHKCSPLPSLFSGVYEIN